MKIAFQVCAVAAVCLLAVRVSHADATDPRTQVVQYTEFNLSNDAGVAAVYRRVNAAAESVCRDFGFRDELRFKMMFRECVAQAIAKAVVGINHPKVSGYAALRMKSLGSSVAKIASTR